MENEDHNIIPLKESDEVIKSSVEDLVPIPNKFEDTSRSDSVCDLHACDDFSPSDVPEGKSVTFSNPLFDSNDQFTFSDDESISDEDVLEDNDTKSKVSYDSNLNEPNLLVTPLFDVNKDECFDPEGDVDKNNSFDIPLDFEDGYYDSEGDVLYLESLLSDDTTPNLPFERIVSPTYVSLPFKDRHYLFFTYVIRIFLPYFTYPMDSPLLLSFGSEDTNFDPGIFAFSFYSLESVVSHRSGTFMIASDYEDSRARGFVHRLLELLSMLIYGNMIS
nr:hypothetical protein [Tanacetum cinerariifolium]